MNRRWMRDLRHEDYAAEVAKQDAETAATAWVQCPFCEKVHRDDGPPVLCCGETKCLPISADEAQRIQEADYWALNDHTLDEMDEELL